MRPSHACSSRPERCRIRSTVILLEETSCCIDIWPCHKRHSRSSQDGWRDLLFEETSCYVIDEAFLRLMLHLGQHLSHKTARSWSDRSSVVKTNAPSRSAFVMRRPIVTIIIFRLIVFANENYKGGSQLCRGRLGDRHLVMLLQSCLFSRDYNHPWWNLAWQHLEILRYAGAAHECKHWSWMRPQKDAKREAGTTSLQLNDNGDEYDCELSEMSGQ